jgi:predicted  nucleic acid-binding Zn-ribbon protein
MVTQDRTAYAKKVGTDLNELTTRLSILEAAAKQKAGDQTFDFESHIGEFRQRRDDIESRLESLEDGGATDWENTRMEIETAIDELRDDLADAMHEAGLTSEREKERKGQPEEGQQEGSIRA